MVRKALMKNRYYKKTDGDGDMFFEISGNEDFRPVRFVWVLLKHDHITVSTGVNDFKKLADDMDFDKVCSDYNSRSTGIEAWVSSGTIRLRKRLEIENYSSTSPTDAVIADIDKAISEIMQQWEGRSRRGRHQKPLLRADRRLYKRPFEKRQSHKCLVDCNEHHADIPRGKDHRERFPRPRLYKFHILSRCRRRQAQNALLPDRKQ